MGQETVIGQHHYWVQCSSLRCTRDMDMTFDVPCVSTMMAKPPLARKIIFQCTWEDAKSVAPYHNNTTILSYIKLCEATQMRFVTLSSVLISFDIFLLLFGDCYGGQSNRLATGYGQANSRDGILLRVHTTTTKITSGRRRIHRRTIGVVLLLRRHCCRLADGTLMKRDMVLDQVETE